MLEEHGSGVLPGKHSQTVPVFGGAAAAAAVVVVAVVVACPPPPQPAAAMASDDEERYERAPGHAATVPAAVEPAVLTGVNTWSVNGRGTTMGCVGSTLSSSFRLGNAAYGAGLCLLMLGERAEATEWLGRASARWRESWEHATPTSWGRPIGVIKAALIAGDDQAAAAFAAWALGLGCTEAESAIGMLRRSLCSSRVVTPRRPVSQRACVARRFPPRLQTRSSGSRRAPTCSTAQPCSACSPRSRRARSTWRTFRLPTP